MSDVQELSPEEIKSDERNANKGTERGNALIEQSLRQLGAGRSVLLDKDNQLIAGNKTFEQAKKLGYKIRVVDIDPNELLAVRRPDLDLDSFDDDTGRKLAYADNRSSELNLSWDEQVISEDIDKGVQLELFGWFDYEIGDIRDNAELSQAGGSITTGGQEFEGDYAPWEVNAVPRTNEKGELEPVRELILRYRSKQFMKLVAYLGILKKEWKTETTAETIAKCIELCMAEVDKEYLAPEEVTDEPRTEPAAPDDSQPF